MKLERLLYNVNKEKPNSLSNEYLTGKVNEVEAIVQTYLEVPISKRTSYKWPEDTDSDLIVPEPHSRLYMSYLKACIDLANEELESYTNNQAQFEIDYQEWTGYVTRNGIARRTAPVKIRGWW